MSEANDREVLFAQADQRMLEAAIQEVVEEGARPGAATVDHAVGSPNGARGIPVLAAAIVLLGCAVVVSLALLRSEPTFDEVQRPELPPAVQAIGAEELSRIDAATQHLELSVSSPEELAGVVRLRALRALSIRAILQDAGDQATDEAAWQAAGADALEVLTQCARLERVSIGFLPGLHPDACSVLQRLPNLRDVELVGTRKLVDRKLVTGWSKLRLERVKLTAVRIDREGFDKLCELPLLRELLLENVLHLDRCDLRSLGRSRQLRKLVLRGVGSRFSSAMAKSNPLPGDPPEHEEEPAQNEAWVIRTGWQTYGELRLLLAPAVMDVIAGLPQLDELHLRGSVVDDEVMARLPVGLRTLHLGVTIGLTPESIRGLARLERLQSLTWSNVEGESMLGAAKQTPAALEPAWIDLLAGLRLRSASYHGAIHEPLRVALAKQIELQRFEWFALGDPAVSLTFLASLPSVQELLLANVEPFDTSVLAKMPALERLELWNATPAVKESLRRFAGDVDIELAFN